MGFYRTTFKDNHLKHFGQKGMILHITYRLDDSIPIYITKKYIQEINRMNINDIEKERIKKLYMDIYDHEDDRCKGECLLTYPGVCEIILEDLFYLNNDKFNLLVWALMPNHVHLMIRLLTDRLDHCMQLIKGRSARKINLHLNRKGTLWGPGYFDRPITTVKQFNGTTEYIMNNAKKCYWTDKYTGKSTDFDFDQLNLFPE